MRLNRRGQAEIPGIVILLIGVGVLLYGLFVATDPGNRALFIGVGLLLLGVGEIATFGGRGWQVTVPVGALFAIIGLLILLGVL